MDGCGSTQKAATRLRPAPTEPDVQDAAAATLVELTGFAL